MNFKNTTIAAAILFPLLPVEAVVAVLTQLITNRLLKMNKPNNK